MNGEVGTVLAGEMVQARVAMGIRSHKWRGRQHEPGVMWGKSALSDSGASSRCCKQLGRQRKPEVTRATISRSDRNEGLLYFVYATFFFKVLGRMFT